jgi:hypothetical protein
VNQTFGISEAEANTRLIAAAPELLAVLENIRKAQISGRATVPTECWAEMIAAIAKARGEA